MSDKDFRIPAIKYYELHGLDKDHPYPRSRAKFPNLNSVLFPFCLGGATGLKDLRQVQGIFRFPDPFAMFPFSLLIPFVFFGLPAWFHWFAGGYFSGRGIDAGESIYAVLVAPVLETLIFFVPLLEIVRVLSMPRWFSYPLVFVFFESLHHQRYFYEHPLMWMTGYMFIVSYEAGRTRSLLHGSYFARQFTRPTTLR